MLSKGIKQSNMWLITEIGLRKKENTRWKEDLHLNIDTLLCNYEPVHLWHSES